MLNNINFISKELSNNQATVVFINEQLKLDNELLLLDQQHHGLISKTIQNKLVFAGKFGQIKIINSIGKDGEIRYYFIMTTGSLASNFALQDLCSRINAVVRLEINQPDDELMTKLIFKYFSDQSLKVSDCVIEYLLINLPRQFDQMIKLLEVIMHFALVHKRAITVPLIKQVLK